MAVITSECHVRGPGFDSQLNPRNFSWSKVSGNGPGGASGKALRYGLDGPGSIPGVGGGGDFSSLFRVQTGPGVHSTSYKMSTGEFPRG